MGKIDWFDRRPGGSIAKSQEDPSMFLLGDSTPEWVRLPANLGRTPVKVLALFGQQCPMCPPGSEIIKHLELEQSINVAECVDHGFVWYIRKERSDD